MKIKNFLISCQDLFVRNNFKLDFVKFFPVKSPLGINQNSDYTKSSEYHSIGVDLYFPKMTLEFIIALLKSNPKYSTKELLKNKTFGSVDYFTMVDANGELVLSYEGKIFHIYKKVQIPSGIGLIIPKNFYLFIYL